MQGCDAACEGHMRAVWSRLHTLARERSSTLRSERVVRHWRMRSPHDSQAVRHPVCAYDPVQVAVMLDGQWGMSCSYNTRDELCSACESVKQAAHELRH